MTLPEPPGPAGASGAPVQRRAERIEVRLLIVSLAAVVVLAGFAFLAAEVREGDVFAVDRIVLLAFRVPGRLDIAVGPRWLQESARDVTALGGFTVLALVATAAIGHLAMHGRRAQAAVFGATVVFAQAASEVLKHVIGRPRPTLVPQHDLVYSASFPSGHAMMAPVVYLTLAAVVAAGERGSSQKVLLLGSASALVVAIGVTRVYLGVHWPTDVLAGWALGCVIALAATLILRRVAPRAILGGPR
jgi:undecaprenyl-diphosphatase